MLTYFSSPSKNKHVPIPMIDMDCPRKCCNARYCPLVLAWATTVHKFQGFEAGFDDTDEINYIVADLNTLDWEKKNPGTAYVVASRAKTIGEHTDNNPYPKKSNLFFTGTIGAHRFTRCLYKDNGELCLKVQKRELWVQYLAEKVQQTKMKRSDDDVNTTKTFVLNATENYSILDKKDLHRRIIDILTHPSEEWKTTRAKYIL